MAVQETNLGHFDYIALYSKDADKTTMTGTVDGKIYTVGWKWKCPTMDRRKSPSWFVSVVSAYLDDSQGAGLARPHMLRFKTYCENYKTYETTASGGANYAEGLVLPSQYINYPICAILVEDQNNGHYYTLSQDNVVLQLTSNIQYLEFDVLDCFGNNLPIEATIGETLNIVLKVTYPERTEVMVNTTQAYAPTINPLMTPKSFNTF